MKRRRGVKQRQQCPLGVLGVALAPAERELGAEAQLEVAAAPIKQVTGVHRMLPVVVAQHFLLEAQAPLDIDQGE